MTRSTASDLTEALAFTEATVRRAGALLTASYERVEKIAGRASTGILVVVVIALAANALRLRRKERRGEGLGPVG